jgi:ABC-type ATPase involved in cell division
MISMFHLTVGDPRGRGDLFEDVTFEVPTGSWTEFVGGPSCGKSLLFALLSLRARATQGTLVMGGRNLKKARRRHVEALRRRMGSCGQRPVLLEDRTALENVLMALVARGARAGAREQAQEALARVGLERVSGVRAEALTPEERVALGVARATVGEPALVVLDGVFEAMGERRARRTAGVLKALHARGTTVVVFGREFSGVAPGKAQELRIEDGRIERVERVALARSPESVGPRR